MGIFSAMNTALTGMTASEATIDVAGNNLANANTVGFKASEAAFANQFLQTKSLGSSPSESNGGTNPTQFGLGVMVAAVTPNFSQGTIEISSNKLDMAIQGDGFFIVQGGQGEQLYTRNGLFEMNANDELVDLNGNRVLGYNADENFVVQRTTLEPLVIPLGGKQVCKATENVVIEGALTPTGNVADRGTVLRTERLGDGSYTYPEDVTATTVSVAVEPDVTGTTANVTAGAGNVGVGDYRYKFVFADYPYTDAPLSFSDSTNLPTPVPVAIDGSTVDFTGIPSSANYDYVRIYRQTAGAAEGDPYYYVGEDGPGSPFPGDTLSDAELVLSVYPRHQLNETTITGSYQYYAVWKSSSGGADSLSRPSPVLVAPSVTAGRIQLTGLPEVPSPADKGNWDRLVLYRNTATDSNTFYRVAELDGSVVPPATEISFTDGIPDATIEATGDTLDLVGPKIRTSTLLTNILPSDSNTSIFAADTTISFAGEKGGITLNSQTFNVTATSTVQDLLVFLNASLGIVTPPGADPANPIPSSLMPDGSMEAPGLIRVVDGQMQIVGNCGEGNRVAVKLGSLKKVIDGGFEPVSLSFGEFQAATGESAITDFIAYDSLGIPVSVRLTAVMESKTNASTTYRWYAQSPNNEPTSGISLGCGSGLITFDSTGNVTKVTSDTVTVLRNQTASVSPLQFDLDFTQLSGLRASYSTLAVSRQDGSPPGVLTSFIVGEDGLIRGVFSNGISRDLGQLRLARFANPASLEQKGQNLYSPGVNSGLAIMADPGQQGIGNVISGARELSNSDVGTDLVDLILASTLYRGNARVITTSNQMLDELLALGR